VVEDPIDVLHQQARAMKGLAEQVERTAGHMPLRVRALAAPTAAKA
jgi:hypothetical protein